MKQRTGFTDRSPLEYCVDGKWVENRYLCCFTMSSNDYDDRPLSSPRSIVDLYTPRSRPRVRSGSLGAEDPTISTHTHYSERSSIRINTDLTVRAHSITPQNIHFQSSCLSTVDADVWDLPSLASTRKIALACCDNDSQARRRLAAFDRCAIVPRTFYFHLGSRDSRRHKSARKARPVGRARRPSSPDDKQSASPGPCGPRKKVSKVDPVVRRDALPSVRNAPVTASKRFK